MSDNGSMMEKQAEHLPQTVDGLIDQAMCASLRAIKSLEDGDMPHEIGFSIGLNVRNVLVGVDLKLKRMQGLSVQVADDQVIEERDLLECR